MTRFDIRLFLALLLLALVALLSLLIVPLEQLQPPRLHFTALQFRLLSLINPTVMVLASAALGCWLAPKVGLDAPVIRALVARRDAWPTLRPQLLPALAIGVIVAAILLGYAKVAGPWFAGVPGADLPMPLATKLLYGGVVEELLTRWGLMSLFVWVAWKIARSPTVVPGWAYVVGAIVAALLFAAGHLPLLYLLMPHPAAVMITAVLVGNAVPGLMFAWAFRRFGLEAAMLAHALAHLFSTAVG